MAMERRRRNPIKRLGRRLARYTPAVFIAIVGGITLVWVIVASNARSDWFADLMERGRL